MVANAIIMKVTIRKKPSWYIGELLIKLWIKIGYWIIKLLNAGIDIEVGNG